MLPVYFQGPENDADCSNPTMGMTDGDSTAGCTNNSPSIEMNTIVDDLAESLTSRFVGPMWKQFNMNQGGMGLSSSCETHPSFASSHNVHAFHHPGAHSDMQDTPANSFKLKKRHCHTVEEWRYYHSDEADPRQRAERTTPPTSNDIEELEGGD